MVRWRVGDAVVSIPRSLGPKAVSRPSRNQRMGAGKSFQMSRVVLPKRREPNEIVEVKMTGMELRST